MISASARLPDRVEIVRNRECASDEYRSSYPPQRRRSGLLRTWVVGAEDMNWITIATLVCGIVLAAPTPAAATDADPTPAPSAPVVTFVGTASADERAMVAWAADRFVAAGLQLPDVTVSFPVICRSEDDRPLAGRYLVGRREIELCCPSRRLALHELAHAWDDASDLDRAALLEELELDHWYAQPGRPSTDSGGEQLALIVTWGLMDVDLTHPVPAWEGQPIAQQPRSLPQLPGRTTADLTRLFEQIVRVVPLSPSAASSSVDRCCVTGPERLDREPRYTAPPDAPSARTHPSRRDLRIGSARRHRAPGLLPRLPATGGDRGGRTFATASVLPCGAMMLLLVRRRPDVADRR